jgi:hypothetical protein
VSIHLLPPFLLLLKKAYNIDTMTDNMEKQIESLCNNREEFNKFVYTPIDEAIKELEKIKCDKKIEEYVEKILKDEVPEIIKKGRSMVLFRHIATLNYEIRRFIIAADGLEVLNPVIFEYTEDKFNNRNDWKYSLGKISLHKGTNKKGEQLFECKNIIDFNESNNKPINCVRTKWNQTLVDFHHEIFVKGFPNLKDNIFDLSKWLHSYGKTAKEYYKPFFTLFLRDGILFENFLLDGKELPFTKEVILPTIMEIFEETGVKPLIVALEPTDIEGDQFWLSHPPHEKEFIEGKMKK